MRNLLLFVSSICVSAVSFSQLIDHPKASLTLKIEQSSGTNGAAVAYNPVSELYYCVMAGNASYPLEVFDKNGNGVYQTNAGVDMRGIWWNPKTKTLEGNGYGESGIVSFAMDENDYPSLGIQTVFPGGDHQADAQSVGTFDSKKNLIMYYNQGVLYSYKRSNGQLAKKTILNNPSENNTNAYTVVYTGVKKMEVGLLDYTNNKVLLFNSKTGHQTATIHLPNSATTNHAFRFSYANKYVLLYDTDSRSWTGYKIFQ